MVNQLVVGGLERCLSKRGNNRCGGGLLGRGMIDEDCGVSVVAWILLCEMMLMIVKSYGERGEVKEKEGEKK